LEIIADTPGNLAAHYYLGLCYYGNGNRSKACEHLTICIDASREAAAQSTADWVGFDEGTGSVEGVASVESLIAASAQKKFPFPQALIARANTYFRMGNFSLAFKDLDEVWQIYHDAPEQQALAISYCQNNLASIRARFSRAIEGHSRKIDSLERHEAQLQERTTTSLAAIDAQIAPLEEQIKTADLDTAMKISSQLLELKKRKKAIMEEEQSQSKQSELESAIRDLAAARRHLASVERAISVLQARTTGR
jgi:tetratricopeptide (TPR) repeat protein